MNLNDPRHPWTRLTAAARQLPDHRDAAAPFGFATRVAALALGQRLQRTSLLERFALRAFSIACLLAVLSVAVNYSALTVAAPQVVMTEDFALPPDDAVAVVLDLTD